MILDLLFQSQSLVHKLVSSNQDFLVAGFGTTPLFTVCLLSSFSARTRVDGKEFFRQVRSRLSYEQFGAFLGNVKDLNAHKQTREVRRILSQSSLPSFDSKLGF